MQNYFPLLTKKDKSFLETVDTELKGDHPGLIISDNLI